MLTQILFYTGILIGYAYMLLLIWSILTPSHRIWPPGEVSWKFFLSWGTFYLGIGIAVALIVLDWNTWTIPPEVRLGIGVPLTTLGLGLVAWGIRTLGLTNTHGIQDGFILSGPYRFTRNPQYVGDIIMITGIILIVNSALVAVVSLIILFSFVLLPIAEEPWLEEQYGEEYLRYKTQTPRFL